MRLSIAVAVALVFLVSLSVSRGFLIVNYSNSPEKYSVYENLYISTNSLHSEARGCGNSNDLSDRHQLRKSLWEIKMKIYSLAKDYFGFTGVGAAFSLLHAIAVSITFWFVYKTTLLVFARSLHKVGNKKNTRRGEEKAIIAVSVLIFLAFFSYTFNGHVGEYTYSVFEALFISVAFFSALKRNIAWFIIATSFAILNRESGFMLLMIWVLVNGVNFNKIRENFYLLIPVLVFLVANNDIVHCVVKDGFLVSSEPLPGQLTFHIFTDGVWGVIRGVITILFNYGIFIAPMTLSYFWLKSNPSVNLKVINKVVIITTMYFLVFLVATPLNHMSVKFIVIPFIVPLLSMYIVGLVQKTKYSFFDI